MKLIMQTSFYAFGIILLLISKSGWVSGLKCRTTDGLSETELKRIARSCMRKVSEGVPYSQSGSRYHGYAAMAHNSDYDRSDSGFQDSAYPANFNDYEYNSYGDQNYNNFKHSNSRHGNDDMSRQYNQRGRDRERENDMDYDRGNDMNRFHRNRPGSAGSSTSRNNDRTRHDDSNSNNSQKSGINIPGNNRRISNGKENRANSSNNDGNSTYDAACIVHCFFNEMNVLNSDDYPDKHKTQYMLTKDIRDRELRNFYTDSVHECFHLMDTQRRRDKCSFSRELVHCLMEYARASCEDWEDYTLFN